MRNVRDKTVSQQQVEQFMEKAGQTVPTAPVMPNEETRILRAKLIFEEAIRELLGEGLAVTLHVTDDEGFLVDVLANKERLHIRVHPTRQPNLTLIADGAADTEVVVKGTLSACGIADARLQEMVNESNLAKFTVPKCPDCGKPMVLAGCGAYWECEEGFRDPVSDFGGYRSDGTDGNTTGKWIKPKGWTAPDVGGLLAAQRHGLVQEDDPYPVKQVPVQDVKHETTAEVIECLSEKTTGGYTRPGMKTYPIATAPIPFVINVPAVAREFLLPVGPKSHPGWWAVVDDPQIPPGPQQLEFRCNGELVDEGFYIGLYLPGTLVQGDPDNVFRDWYKIAYHPARASLRRDN